MVTVLLNNAKKYPNISKLTCSYHGTFSQGLVKRSTTFLSSPWQPLNPHLPLIKSQFPRCWISMCRTPSPWSPDTCSKNSEDKLTRLFHVTWGVTKWECCLQHWSTHNLLKGAGRCLFMKMTSAHTCSDVIEMFLQPVKHEQTWLAVPLGGFYVTHAAIRHKHNRAAASYQ